MEMYRETSESRQHDATNLQQGSLTVQKQSNTFSKKIQEQQATTNNSKNRWDHNKGNDAILESIWRHENIALYDGRNKLGNCWRMK
ncbi:2356_t:CDS:2, partial [Rhizophagus irregularis]